MQVSDGRHATRLYIESYGAGGFRVSGVAHRGSLLLGTVFVAPWPATSVAEASPSSLAPLLDAEIELKILILGCGPRITPPASELRAALKSRGVALELMDTGAACRTFNLLMAEERPVGAALIAL